MKRFFHSKWLAAPAAALFAASARDAYACAMCGLPAGDIATHAYNTSVLFLLTVPYAIVATATVVGFVAYRNANRRRSAEENSDPQPFSNR